MRKTKIEGNVLELRMATATPPSHVHVPVTQQPCAVSVRWHGITIPRLEGCENKVYLDTQGPWLRKRHGNRHSKRWKQIQMVLILSPPLYLPLGSTLHPASTVHRCRCEASAWLPSSPHYLAISPDSQERSLFYHEQAGSWMPLRVLPTSSSSHTQTWSPSGSSTFQVQQHVPPSLWMWPLGN